MGKWARRLAEGLGRSGDGELLTELTETATDEAIETAWNTAVWNTAIWQRVSRATQGTLHGKLVLVSTRSKPGSR